MRYAEKEEMGIEFTNATQRDYIESITEGLLTDTALHVTIYVGGPIAGFCKIVTNK